MRSVLESELIGKLVYLALLAAGGTAYVLYRKMMSAADRSSIHGTIRSLRKGNVRVKDTASALDVPYATRHDFFNEDFKRLKSSVKSSSRIDDFTILYQAEVDMLQYLLIIEIQFSDFDISVFGDSRDVNRKAFHSFVVRFVPDKNLLVVCSDLYSDTTSKFQKEAFGRGIIKL